MTYALFASGIDFYTQMSSTARLKGQLLVPYTDCNAERTTKRRRLWRESWDVKGEGGVGRNERAEEARPGGAQRRRDAMAALVRA